MNPIVASTLRAALPGLAADAPGLVRAAEAASPVNSPSGTALLPRSEPPAALAIGRGAVGLFAVDRAGRAAGLALFGPGALLTSALLTETEALTYELRALGDVEAVRVPLGAMERAATEDRALAAALAAKADARTATVLRFASEAVLLSAEARLALRLAEIARHRTPGAVAHAPLGRITQSDLAELIGTTRRRVSTILTAWFRAGLVFQDAHQVLTVLDLRTLTAAARESGSRAAYLFSIDRLLDAGVNEAAHALAADRADAEPKVRAYTHRAALALARSGDAVGAAGLLDAVPDADLPAEGHALRGRLHKDAAETALADERAARLQAASDAYEAAHAAAPDGYAALNVAACRALLSDQAGRALWAGRALDAAPQASAYWTDATRAEALMLLGRRAEGRSAYAALRAHAERSPARIAATRAQLARLAEAVPDAAGLSDTVFVPPGEVHVAGVTAAPGPAEERALRAWVREQLAAYPHDTVLGAVAAGADVVMAEEAVAAGLRFIALLPEPPHRFVQRSVRRFGGAWLPRARALLDAAAHVEVLFPAAARAQPDYVLAGACGLGWLGARAARFGGTATGLFAVGSPPEGQVTRALAALWDRYMPTDPRVFGTPERQDAPVTPLALFSLGEEDDAPLHVGDPAETLAHAESARAADAGGPLLLDVTALGGRYLAADQRPRFDAPGLYASEQALNLLWLAAPAAAAGAMIAEAAATERRDVPTRFYRLDAPPPR